MFCTSCGRQIADGSKFCRYCGTPVASAPAPSASSGSGNTTRRIQPARRQAAPSDDIPTFTAPGNTGRQSSVNTAGQVDIPTFTAPKNDDIPTFTAPRGDDIPTFASPERAGARGKKCYYHSMVPAYSTCARCGKPVCKDCCDSYGVSAGEYEGKTLCYDCTRELVEENVAGLNKNYRTIFLRFIFFLVGIGIGVFIGVAIGVNSGSVGGGIFASVLFGAIGGSALNFFARFFGDVPSFFAMTGSIILDIIIGSIRFCISFFVYAVMAFIETIQKLTYYLSYMKETKGFAESDKESLQNMDDYMEYTRVMQNNRGVSLETLMQEGGELENNSIARMILEQGEDHTEAYMRECVTRIAENGEIIREFAA